MRNTLPAAGAGVGVGAAAGAGVGAGADPKSEGKRKEPAIKGRQNMKWQLFLPRATINFVSKRKPLPVRYPSH